VSPVDKELLEKLKKRRKLEPENSGNEAEKPAVDGKKDAKPRPFGERECVDCGNKFIPRVHNAKRCAECREMPKKKKPAKKKEKPNPFKKCVDCGEDFLPRRKNNIRCQDCIEKNRKKDGREVVDYPERKCIRCGKTYKPWRSDQKYCLDCHKHRKPIYLQENPPQKEFERVCAVPDCGKTFIAKSKEAKYCPECRGKYTRYQLSKKGAIDHKSDNYKKVFIRCQNPACPNEIVLPDGEVKQGVFETTWEQYRKGRKYCDRECFTEATRIRAGKEVEQRKQRRLEERPVQMIEIPYEPLPWQKIVHESTARFKVLNCGNRAGKDRASINEFIKVFADMLSEYRDDTLVPRVMGWLVAPTYKLARQIWRELKYFFPGQWVVGKNESELQLTTIMDGLIEVKSADDPESLVAVGLDAVIITEAARVKRMEEVWANIMARLASPKRGPGGKGGIALINSTPLGMNTFHKMYVWGQDPSMPQWASWTFPTSTNQYIDPAEIEMARRLLPDRLFRQNYLAEFLSDGGEVFANIDDISKGSEQPPDYSAGNVMAWDPAQRHDNSIFGIRNKNGEQVYLGANLTGQKWEDQIARIKVQYDRYRCQKIIIDKTGTGETLPELARRHGMNVEEVYWAGGGTIKQDMVGHFIVLTERKDVLLIDNEMQKNELKAYSYKINPKTRRVSYSAPSGMDDDHVSMLIMLYKDFNSMQVTVPWMGYLGGIKHKKAI